MTIQELRGKLAEASKRVHETADAIDSLPDTASDTDIAHAEAVHADAVRDAEAARDAVAKREAVARARETFQITDQPEVSTPEIRVTKDEPTYRPDGPSFFRDLTLAKGGDPDAMERMRRSNRENFEWATRGKGRDTKLGTQIRAISQTAGAGGEFVPPVWLNDQYAILLRAARAFADQCVSQPLPPGTNSINVPKITTGASTAVQSDGGAVSNTDLVTTSVTAQVQTIAGRTVASYQLFDMGQPNMDAVIYQDLLADYWRTLDINVINGSATNAKGVLNVTGINAVTFTNASPTAKDYWAPLFQGKSQIEKGAFFPAQFVAMHPSTWNYILSGLDSQNRPIAVPQGYPAFNAMGTNATEIAQGVTGNFGGLPVIEDANIPVNLGGGTNESRMIVCNRQTLYLYESAPMFKVADQTNIANLQYQFVLYGYYAVAFPRQPKMISVVSGTGMIVQSGF
jgi:HK97 family phage major capsid protein